MQLGDLVLTSVMVFGENLFDKVVDALQKLPYLRELIIQVESYGPLTRNTVYVGRVVLEFIIGLIVLNFARRFVSQGVGVLYKEFRLLILRGSAIYLFFLLLGFILLVSFVGIPLVMVMLIVAYGIIIFGKVSLAVALGFFIEKLLNDKWYIYLNYMVGIAIIELVGIVPVVGNIFMNVLVPVLAMGSVANTFVNRTVNRINYPVALNGVAEERKYNRSEVRNIIYKDLQKR